MTTNTAEYQREYRKRNPDKVKQYTANYKAKHPDAYKQAYKTRKAKNPNIGKDLYAARKEKSKTDITYGLKGILASSKARAKKYNFDHKLNLEDLQTIFRAQKGLCALTGKKMKTVMGSGHYMVSPDRIDSNKGYTAKNVQLTLSIANKMKQDLTTAAFVKLCKAVVEHHNS